jgi:hypothetical protein
MAPVDAAPTLAVPERTFLTLMILSFFAVVFTWDSGLFSLNMGLTPHIVACTEVFFDI